MPLDEDSVECGAASRDNPVVMASRRRVTLDRERELRRGYGNLEIAVVDASALPYDAFVAEFMAQNRPICIKVSSLFESAVAFVRGRGAWEDGGPVGIGWITKGISRSMP